MASVAPSMRVRGMAGKRNGCRGEEGKTLEAKTMKGKAMTARVAKTDPGGLREHAASIRGQYKGLWTGNLNFGRVSNMGERLRSKELLFDLHGEVCTRKLILPQIALEEC